MQKVAEVCRKLPKKAKIYSIPLYKGIYLCHYKHYIVTKFKSSGYKALSHYILYIFIKKEKSNI